MPKRSKVQKFYITTKNRKLLGIRPIYKNKFTYLINTMKKSRLNYVLKFVLHGINIYKFTNYDEDEIS